jgi:hypothetical protein
MKLFLPLISFIGTMSICHKEGMKVSLHTPYSLLTTPFFKTAPKLIGAREKRFRS